MVLPQALIWGEYSRGTLCRFLGSSVKISLLWYSALTALIFPDSHLYLLIWLGSVPGPTSCAIARSSIKTVRWFSLRVHLDCFPCFKGHWFSSLICTILKTIVWCIVSIFCCCFRLEDKSSSCSFTVFYLALLFERKSVPPYLIYLFSSFKILPLSPVLDNFIMMHLGIILYFSERGLFNIESFLYLTFLSTSPSTLGVSQLMLSHLKLSHCSVMYISFFNFFSLSFILFDF